MRPKMLRIKSCKQDKYQGRTAAVPCVLMGYCKSQTVRVTMHIYLIR